MRSGIARYVSIPALFGAVLLLASCGAQLEKARIHFASENSGDISFQMVVDKGGLPKTGIPSSLIDDVKTCGFEGRQSLRADRYIIDAYYVFNDAGVMATNLDCLPLDWTKREITTTRSSNFWRTRYTTTIWLEQPVLARTSNLKRYFDDGEDGEQGDSGNGDYDTPGLLFPMELKLRVPEKVVSVTDESDLMGLLSVRTATRDDTAEIVMKEVETGTEGVEKRIDALRDALNRGEERPIPSLRYKFVVISQKSELQLTTIIALVGALFGSGALVQLVRWLMARRRA